MQYMYNVHCTCSDVHVLLLFIVVHYARDCSCTHTPVHFSKPLRLRLLYFSKPLKLLRIFLSH